MWCLDVDSNRSATLWSACLSLRCVPPLMSDSFPDPSLTPFGNRSRPDKHPLSILCAHAGLRTSILG
ncbi:hypothetical protein ACTXT7_016447 [Hymenolepis weldensis]